MGNRLSSRPNRKSLASVLALPGPKTGRRKSRRSFMFEGLEPRQVLAANLVISEIMASNNSTLRDEDNQFSDWIEIHNADVVSVNLGDWYLTDNDNALDKWRFPNQTIAPGDYLIVFASGKDRAVANEELHTNFGLSAGGEYVALVFDDPLIDLTPVSSFDPRFPSQLIDVSFGFNQTATNSTLLAAGAPVTALVPSNGALGTSWTAPGFDDGSWTSGTSGVGYDTGSDFDNVIGLDLPGMQNNGTSAYIRAPFNVSNPGAVDRLSLEMKYDDGFVAYLNGTEVARANAPASPAWNSTATAVHGEPRTEVTRHDFDTTGPGDHGADSAYTASQWGPNQTAAQIVSTGGLAGSGSFLRIVHDTINDNVNRVSFDRTQVGPSPRVIADFDFRFSSTDQYADGMSFILLPTSIYGPSGQGSDGSYASEEPNIMGAFAVGFDLYPNENDVSIHWNGAEIQNANVLPGQLNLSNATWHHAHIVLEETDGGSLATVTLTPNISGTPGTPITPINNVFIPGLTPYENRVEFSARTGGLNLSADIDNLVVEHETSQTEIQYETFNLNSFTNLLVPGENVLAIHALNISASDKDVLAVPQLQATTLSPIDVNSGGQYFITPTPTSTNGLGVVNPPSGPVGYSRDSGTFTDSFQLELSAEPGSTIYYTLNGTVPSTSSPVYTGPLTISNTTQVRARSQAPGGSLSKTVSRNFVALDASVENFSSNLPIVVLDTFGVGGANPINLSETTLTPTAAIFIETQADGRADFNDPVNYAGRSGLRLRGQTSQGFPKRPFAFETWEEDNSDLNVSLLGMPANGDWVFMNPYSEKPLMQNYLATQWARDIGMWASDGRFVEVFVNGDGDGKINYAEDYAGVYLFVEKIEIDNDRLDLEELSPSDNTTDPGSPHTGPVTGGYIWKKDKCPPGGQGVRTITVPALNRTAAPTIANGSDFGSCFGANPEIFDPDDSVVTSQQAAWLQGYLTEFVNTLNGPNWNHPTEGYKKFIDTASWVDHWIMVEMMKQIDGFRLSTYYSKDRDGKIKMEPVWDYNLSMGNADYLQGGIPTGWYHSQSNTFNGQSGELTNDNYPFWRLLFSDPDFKQALVDRWRELRQTVFTNEKLLGDIDSTAALLSEAAVRNYQEYPVLGVDLWPNFYFLEPGKTPATQTYQDDVNWMRNQWFVPRLAWMDTQFLQAPTFGTEEGVVAPGTPVTMTSTGTPTFVETTLVAPTATKRAIVPTAALNTAIGTSWRNRVFDDSTWLSGANGVGYERGTGYEGDLGINLLTVEPPSMRIDVDGNGQNDNNSVYIRVPFNFTGNVAAIDRLFLRVRYDDAYVAYLNGTEIGRGNFAGEPAWNAPTGGSIPGGTHEASGYEEIDVTAFKNLLLAGNNVLAIHGINDLPGSSDMLILPTLVAGDEVVVAAHPVYYTTDGSDPRLSGGAISPTATLYNSASPPTIGQNTKLIARARNATTGEWSGISDGIYLTAPTRLVVTEVNFNPATPTAAEALAGLTDNELFEFIELKNIGTTPIDLTGASFTDGLDFTFPAMTLAAGDHVVIVKNQAAYEFRYGTGDNIAGEFGGNLANDGDHLALRTALGEVTMDFTFDDGWYALTDGGGYSLTIVNPLAAADSWDLQASWRPSDYLLGSPDQDDAGLAPPQGALKINEILVDGPSGDRIEIRNTSATPISIDGFYLTDEPIANPRKYQFPTSTPDVPANGFLVLNAETSFGTAIDLSRNGGTLMLHSADGSGVETGFRTTEDYFASEPNTAHGRYDKSDGTNDFVPLVAATLGAANAAPAIGQVVINEVLYHPRPGQDEYIELRNVGGSPVSLEGWTLENAVDFQFPEITLAPGEFLVVTGGDPEQFRTIHSVPASVQIVGPFAGVLDDDDPNGESIQLHRPPTGDGTVSVLVDRVRYFSEAPWPVGASGNGLGLIRLDAGAYGNDIINWGDGLIGGTPGVGNVAFETSPPSSPGVPTVSVQPDGDISLSFGAANDPQSGIMRYRVFRAAPPGTPSAVEIGNSATTSFTDESVALNQAYSYTVRAENYSGILGSASTSPQQIRVFGMTGFTKVDATHFRVTFSETVSTASAQNLANYVLSNATLVSAVREAAGTSVLLETAQPIVEGTGYRVMANNLVGTAAGINSVILPNSTRSVIPGVANGLLGEYFDEPTLTVFATPPASAEVGPKVGERTDPVINFVWLQQPNPYTGGSPPFVPNATLPISARDTIGVRWTGRLIAPAVTGSYTFSFTISSNDGVRFWIDTDDDGVFEDSERVVNAWPAASSPQTGAVNLVGNQAYDIRIDFFESNSTAQIVMNWQYPGQSLINVPSANMLTPVTTESNRPNVTAIKLGSSDWTAAFKSQLQAAGFGTGGVNLPVGGTSARLPWSNLNQVSMTFDEDVNVTPESLLVNGVNAASYGVLDVAYDLATYTATWTLASPLPADRVTLSLSSAAADLVGNTVEGATGGTVLALPGDVNQSGAVDAADFRASLDAQFRGIGSPGYSVLLDTDGNGAINIQDWQNVQVAIGDTIPAPSPAAAPGAVVASGNTSRLASDRSSGAGGLRVTPASRLSRLAVDQVVATPSESSARTLRASRAPRTTAVNPAVIDQLFAN